MDGETSPQTDEGRAPSGVANDAPQLDLADEQAAAIRRELDARREKVSEMERVRTSTFSSSS